MYCDISERGQEDFGLRSFAHICRRRAARRRWCACVSFLVCVESRVTTTASQPRATVFSPCCSVSSLFSLVVVRIVSYLQQEQANRERDTNAADFHSSGLIHIQIVAEKEWRAKVFFASLNWEKRSADACVCVKEERTTIKQYRLQQQQTKHPCREQQQKVLFHTLLGGPRGKKESGCKERTGTFLQRRGFRNRACRRGKN